MHPTIDEQLEGIARLIDRTASRHPDDPSIDRLRTAAGTLRRIAGSWGEILPYLTWDNQAMTALLEEIANDQPGSAAADADRRLAQTVDPTRVGEMHDRNKELRGLLAEAVRQLPADPAPMRAKIAAHLRERIARDPSSGRS